MAGGAFGGTDRQFARVFAENGFDRLRFGNVTLRRGSAVGVDVGNVCPDSGRALRKAIFMQRAAPSPSGEGAVRWLASAVLP